MMRSSNKFEKIYLFIVFAILYLPIFYLIFYSFNADGTMNQFTGFTLEYYAELFEDKRLIIIVLNTVLLALLSSLIATLIGTFGAMGIYFIKNKRIKNSLLSLNNVLMVSPDVIIGSSFLIFFTMLGIGLGFKSVLISHIAFSIPIVVLMVLPRMNEISESVFFAARDLGASSAQIIGRVILPMIAPGILAGFFMAFTYSLDDFAVTFFVTGNGFSTLSVEIYSRARQGVSLTINALSTLMFLFSLLLVAGYYFLTTKNQKKKLKVKAVDKK